MDAVILAAGKSSRMKTHQSKIFYDLCGKNIIEHIIDSIKAAGFDNVIVVSNPEHLHRINRLGAWSIVQEIPNGTAKACELALSKLSNDFLVTTADIALIKSDTLRKAKDHFLRNNLDCLLLVGRLEDPKGYGRVILNQEGFSVVEEKDASQEVLNINLVSSGIFFLRKDFAEKALPKIGNNNAQLEYYLPDILKLSSLSSFLEIDSKEILGINTQKDYSRVRKILQNQIIENHMKNGVIFINPDTVYIDINVELGSDTIIYPNVHLRGNTKIGKNCTIDAGSIIDSSIILENTLIKPYSVITDSYIEKNCSIGPFSQLRPKTQLKENVHIGNFVEVKKSILGENTKASHLSYIGDAILGQNVNVGAGTITCNYDGFRKNETIIGDNVFIGSDTQLVAPLKIGNDCLIAAGTTVTKDTPAYSLVISRVPQQIKKDWVFSFRERFKKDK